MTTEGGTGEHAGTREGTTQLQMALFDADDDDSNEQT
jgi:hypothetical protein